MINYLQSCDNYVYIGMLKYNYVNYFLMELFKNSFKEDPFYKGTVLWWLLKWMYKEKIRIQTKNPMHTYIFQFSYIDIKNAVSSVVFDSDL